MGGGGGGEGLPPYIHTALVWCDYLSVSPFFPFSCKRWWKAAVIAEISLRRAPPPFCDTRKREGERERRRERENNSGTCIMVSCTSRRRVQNAASQLHLHMLM